MWIIILIFIAILLFLYLKFFTIPKFSNLVLVTGGLKCGKSAFSLYSAIKVYKRNVRGWKIRNFLIKIINIFKKNKLHEDEKPVFYSNIPLQGIEYSTIDLDCIRLKKRLARKSVMFIDEASLFADSMSYKKIDSDEIMLFIKLYAHITHGGSLFFNTQCLTDLHFAIKRCVSSYYYIYHLTKVPFFLIANVREMLYCGDTENVVNTTSETLEDSTKMVLFSKSIFKKYDRYCYSCFTDNKELWIVPMSHTKTDSLKTNYILSFKDYSKYLVVDELKKGVENNDQ